MKVPLEWLNDFTTIQVEPEEFCEAMTMSGSKVESCESVGEDLTGVVTGRIVDIKKHPDADKLQICTVDIGSGHLTIVTGATNIRVGQVVPVALDGATLPHGNVVRSSLLRGQLSQGMLCSVTELGCNVADFPSAAADGIFVLPADTMIGQDIKTILHLDDVVIDFEITSNRADCFSVEGLGREAAVTLGQPFEPVLPAFRADCPERSADLADIRIDAPDLCYRYCGHVIRDVRVGPSPEWMRRRLRGAGLRPINNIVDITNYVMLELGQPLHAFDLNQLAGQQIIARRAHEGEVMRTLDGVDRHLKPDMLVIADRDRAVALAGVMGAENSEITQDTSLILFESATFHAPAVRQAAKNVGLRTESSIRFEKGLDVNNAARAMARACELVELLGAGRVCQGMIDVWPVRPQPRIIVYSARRINTLLGTNIASDWMVDKLGELGIETVSSDHGLKALIPSYRSDLVIEADLAEEIARLYGYNRIEPSLLSGKGTTLGGRSREQKYLEKIKDQMIAQGFFEACTYSFESPKQMDKLLVPATHPLRRSIQIKNPLGEDYSMMRTSLAPSLLEVASTNWNRSIDRAGVFEIAFVYHPEQLPLNQLPAEKRHLGAFLYDENEPQSGGEYFRLKGVVEEMAIHLGLASLAFVPLSDCPWLHPGRQAAILTSDGKAIGTLGVIHPEAAANYAVSPRTALLDLEIGPLLAAASHERQYRPLPKFPAVIRDLAIVVDVEITAAALSTAIVEAGGEILETIRLFDVYQGPQVPSGKKSLAYNLVFRSFTRTLKEDDVQPIMQRIRNALQEEFQAVLRE
ncbi:MAG: phenylalanine--tRNA ligase subunit beta [Clostridiaceae bacterium]|nr:phenylalanine--tRNA ligase subunit beta [Clostridiaceae bacterium]